MYANWFACNPSPATPYPASYYPGNNLVPSPDVLLELESPPITSRFWAHSHIICQYSGYLRSAVSVSCSTSASNNTTNPEPRTIFIPNVTVEQFQPLLRYMYSGFLDLTVDNIFAVLLATHVLHMPYALEICRSFLSRMQAQGLLPRTQPETDPASVPLVAYSKQMIVKPIANRPNQTMSALSLSTPSAPHTLVPSTKSTFLQLGLEAAHITEVNRKGSESPSDESLQESSRRLKKVAAEKVANDYPEKRLNTATMDTVQITTSPTNGKAVLDIASCDGPVRFRRVLNKFYNSASDPCVVDSKEKCLTNSSAEIRQLCGTSFHQQMAKDISESRRGQETPPEDVHQHSIPTGGGGGGPYKCLICKHTFKSEYCYVKHSKRHLIPPPLAESRPEQDFVESEAMPLSLCNSENSDRSNASERMASAKSKPGSSSSGGGGRAVIRPLDMNVQYYPCKSCGSKFPSYYFVHKHRKLCHAQEHSDNGTTIAEETDAEKVSALEAVPISGETPQTPM